MPKLLNKVNLPRYSSAPSTPSEADLYYNTSDDKIYVYTGSAWVEVGSGAGGSGVYYQSDAPVSPNDGDIWIDSDDDLRGLTADEVARITKALDNGGYPYGNSTFNALGIEVNVIRAY